MTSDHIQQRMVLLLTDVHDAARAGDWATVRDKSEQVLHLNPFNHDARAYWALAKNGGVTAEEALDGRIASQLDAVKIAVAVEDWQEAIAESERVLELDPDNAEAKGYIRAAHEAMAPTSRKGGRKASNRPTPVPAAAGDDATRYLYVDNNFLSKAVSGAIAAMSVLYLLAAAFYFYGAGVIDKVDRGEAPGSDATSFDKLATIVASVLALGFAAAFVLFVIWMFREITNARAMGLKTLLSPGKSLLISFIFGTLGAYVVLRDLIATLRGGFSVVGEALMLAWLVGMLGSVALNVNAIKRPADNGEWADLLILVCYGSALLGVAGLCLAYSIRDGHEHLVDRYLRPNRAPRAESTQRVAA